MTAYDPFFASKEALQEVNPPPYTPMDPEMEVLETAPPIFQIRDVRPNDAVIAVMGMTGSGKSTFIQNFCQTAIIGEGLRSMTAKVEAHPAAKDIDGRRVIFVDTPGFDDTDRSDTDILREIVNWLNVTYEKGIKLTGIVYLHGIHLPRLGGTARTNIHLFRKLCGDESMSSVALATTHWGSVESDRIQQRQRHKELIETNDFWKEMIANGAKDFKHDQGSLSALRIVRYLLEQRPPGGMALTVQEEMAGGMTLDQTGVGRIMEEKIDAIRVNYERQIKALKRDLDETRQETTRNDERVRDIEQELKNFEKRLKAQTADKERLKVESKRLKEEHEKELQKEAERVQRVFEERMSRLESEKTAEIEKEKMKRKRLLQNIEQAKGCVVM
ncbi:uncharacterized protein Z520_04326 [Fonsecaea multimorphosa CBS 102226]|uniref:G domain-containing protein n=1 Tax=Fonsecaea multimorphosa CBS 102226 TaxID=1442371 RepID=A0A0D2IRR3_9EURO|nr:uncharacterized protein Z520_04326 [Fonsecaea multimorphosa CBS 102226]KIX99691.1 hypothetical protein Z520_04326 [Fonsecaea multimorphosa CBS 102226]